MENQAIKMNKPVATVMYHSDFDSYNITFPGVVNGANRSFASLDDAARICDASGFEMFYKGRADGVAVKTPEYTETFSAREKTERQTTAELIFATLNYLDHAGVKIPATGDPLIEKNEELFFLDLVGSAINQAMFGKIYSFDRPPTEEQIKHVLDEAREEDLMLVTIKSPSLSSVFVRVDDMTWRYTGDGSNPNCYNYPFDVQL